METNINYIFLACNCEMTCAFPLEQKAFIDLYLQSDLSSKQLCILCCENPSHFGRKISVASYMTYYRNMTITMADPYWAS